MTVPRISPAQAHQRVRHGGAFLVCGYPEAMCRKFSLQGSVTLAALEKDPPSVDAEIIVYCA